MFSKGLIKFNKTLLDKPWQDVKCFAPYSKKISANHKLISSEQWQKQYLNAVQAKGEEENIKDWPCQ